MSSLSAEALAGTLEGFPRQAPLRERLRYFLLYAMLAPSTHNTQPWRFRLRRDGVEVWADRTRRLPVIDHDDRQLFMSVGAALMNLRLALRRWGHAPQIEMFPEADEPDLVARLELGAVARPTLQEIDLVSAIPRRRTNRQAFTGRPVSYKIADELAALAASEGATLTRLTPREKLALAELISLADRQQFASRAFRRELSRWLVAAGRRRDDGIPFAKKEYGSVSPVGPLVVRTFDIGDKVAAKEKELATGSPMLTVLSTPGDDVADWVAAGQAMQLALLGGVCHGLSASFLNQALEIPVIRAQVATLLGDGGHPQLVLRFGFGPPVLKPTPRRPLEQLLID